MYQKISIICNVILLVIVVCLLAVYKKQSNQINDFRVGVNFTDTGILASGKEPFGESLNGKNLAVDYNYVKCISGDKIVPCADVITEGKKVKIEGNLESRTPNEILVLNVYLLPE
jgi:hypothetical protein